MNFLSSTVKFDGRRKTMESLSTLLTISAADVKISVAAIRLIEAATFVAVAAPSWAECMWGCDPCVKQLPFSTTVALHHKDLLRTLHLQ